MAKITVAILHDLLKQYHNDKISFSYMVEKLNEIAASPYEGWYGKLAHCHICTHEWAAVYPCKCAELECPNCGNMTRVPPLNPSYF